MAKRPPLFLGLYSRKSSVTLPAGSVPVRYSFCGIRQPFATGRRSLLLSISSPFLFRAEYAVTKRSWPRAGGTAGAGPLLTGGSNRAAPAKHSPLYLAFCSLPSRLFIYYFFFKAGLMYHLRLPPLGKIPLQTPDDHPLFCINTENFCFVAERLPPSPLSLRLFKNC